MKKRNPLSSKTIIGIDECGRGAVAGPLVIAGVILEGSNCSIRDSKKMTPKQRDLVFNWLLTHSQFNIHAEQPHTIDEIGISMTWDIGVSEVIYTIMNNRQLKAKDVKILIDGNKPCTTLQIDIEQESIIKGDDKIKEIAAASIMAKVWRDNYMINAGENAFPEFNWQKNKGYPTIEHIAAIKKYGITKVFHRETWCKKWI